MREIGIYYTRLATAIKANVVGGQMMICLMQYMWR